jgi:hypothetical protein
MAQRKPLVPDRSGGRNSSHAKSDRAEAWGTWNPPYPRLGMWNPIFDKNTIAECARFDVLVGIFYYDLFWDPTLGPFSDALYGANPDIQLFTYYTACEEWPAENWWGPLHRNPFLPDWPDEWFATEAGTTLAADIDADGSGIPVKDWTLSGPTMGTRDSPWEIFRVDGDVLCDGEIMKIKQLDKANKTLVVERNLHDRLGKGRRHGIAHKAGSRIAPLIGFWPTTYTMNLLPDCPKAQLHGATHPETWGEYHFRMSQTGEGGYFWDLAADKDGVMFDRMEDSISWRLYTQTKSFDFNHDNKPDALADLDARWKVGVSSVRQMFRDKWPKLPLARNKSRSRNFAEYNGENFESCPQFAWDTWDLTPARGRAKYWHQYMFGDKDKNIGGIAEYASQSQTPNATLMVTSDDEANAHPEKSKKYVSMAKPGFVPDYKKMRWGLCTALVAGAVFGYEIDSENHGLSGLLWFDEYDDAGANRGYLGYPKSEPVKLFTDGKNSKYGVWGREYDYGFVIVNPLEYQAEVTLPAGPWQRLKGTQDPLYNDGRVEGAKVQVGPCDGLILKRVLPAQ